MEQLTFTKQFSAENKECNFKGKTDSGVMFCLHHYTGFIKYLYYLEVFSPKMYKFLVEKYIFTFFASELFEVKMKNCK